jgi:aspartate/methionine/tyrosine aminotransferase
MPHDLLRPASDLAARPAVQALQSSEIRTIANAAMGRDDVLAFWFGESDEPTPAFIRAAASTALARGETFYSQNLGRPYLREAIAAYLSRLHARPFAADGVAALGSGVAALMLASQLLLSPGDRVVAVTPLWPNVVEIPKILGAEVVRVPLVVRDGRWALDLDRLLAALTPATRLFIVNSPNNPTGWMLADDEVAVLLAHCRRHGIWVLSDDVYERLVYDPARRSAPSFIARAEPGDRVISANSFSKAWSMTGWRLGWLAAPAALMADLGKLIEYNNSCVFEPTQRAGAVALAEGEPEIARLRQRLAASREALVGGLAALPGIEVPAAGGAMYVFFRIAGYTDSLALARQLVDRAGLGLAPGTAFGPEGAGWLRWCHAVALPRLAAGLERLGDFLDRA